MNLVNTKRNQGLHVTGIASVSCSHHEHFRANGTGNLQKGERWVEFDLYGTWLIFQKGRLTWTMCSSCNQYSPWCQWSSSHMILHANGWWTFTIDYSTCLPGFNYLKHCSPFSSVFPSSISAIMHWNASIHLPLISHQEWDKLTVKVSNMGCIHQGGFVHINDDHGS